MAWTGFQSNLRVSLKGNMKYLIGIDGGGTKTTVAISDLDGNVLGQGTSGPSSLSIVKEDQVKKNIFDALHQARKSIDGDSEAVAVCAGMAGHNTEKDHLYALQILGDMFPEIDEKNRLAFNDVVTGRRSNSDKTFGLCLTSGTGSHAYGVNEAGGDAYVGGLGDMLADEGSAYTIGLAGLRAATRSEDGREESALEELCKEKLEVTEMRDSIAHLFEVEKSEIASFAPLVDRVAEDGDEVAIKILQDSANELVLMIKALVDRLDLLSVECDLVLVGSTINKSRILKEHFEKQIKNKFTNLTIVPAENDPVLGAIKLAKDQFER